MKKIYCEKHKLEKKKPNGLMCRYPVKSIPEADQNVLGGELMSFMKQLFLGEYCPESVHVTVRALNVWLHIGLRN